MQKYERMSSSITGAARGEVSSAREPVMAAESASQGTTFGVIAQSCRTTLSGLARAVLGGFVIGIQGCGGCE